MSGKFQKWADIYSDHFAQELTLSSMLTEDALIRRTTITSQTQSMRGRSSSKTWDAAGFAVYLATQCNIRVLCVRQLQNKIDESVYTLLKIQISRFGLTNQFVITENTIRHKVTSAKFMFYGLWRYIDEIKSLESIDIFWI